MEKIVKDDDQTIKLNKDIAETLISDIPKKWDKFNEMRQSQLDSIKILTDLIFPENQTVDNLRDNPKLPDTYELYDTFKATIWENVYSSPSGMFDVEGRDLDSEKNASKQKALLVNRIEEMKLKLQLEENVDDFGLSGDLIMRVKWRELTEKQRRFKTVKEKADEEAKINYIREQVSIIKSTGMSLNESLNALYKTFGDELTENEDLINKALTTAPNEINVDKYVVEDVVKYKGPMCTAIKAQDFVFDVNRDFDNALKIHRGWLSYDDILSNKSFTLTEKDKEKLKDLATGKDKPDVLSVDKEKIINGDLIEVLYCEGDMNIKTEKKAYNLINWSTVVIGRCVVASFESNPFLECSYIYANILENPRTKRGQSLLHVAAGLNIVSNKSLKQYLTLYDLIINPAWLCEEGSFVGSNKSLKLVPGMVTFYKKLMGQAKAPEPYKPTTVPSQELIQWSKQTQASATGIFPNMTGSAVETQRTAFEVKNEISGQSNRQNRTTDLINMKFITSLVEKIAFCMSNFYDEDLILLSEKDGERQEELKITPEDMQKNFKYTYSDKKASSEKKARFSEFLSFIEKFFKFAPEIINTKELFSYGLEQQDIDNINKFIQDNPLTSVLSQIPQEQRPIFEQKLSEILKQMIMTQSGQIVQPPQEQQPQQVNPQQQGVI